MSTQEKEVKHGSTLVDAAMSSFVFMLLSHQPHQKQNDNAENIANDQSTLRDSFPIAALATSSVSRKSDDENVLLESVSRKEQAKDTPQSDNKVESVINRRDTGPSHRTKA